MILYVPLGPSHKSSTLASGLRCRLGSRHRHAQDRVRTQLALVRSAIQGDHLVIQLLSRPLKACVRHLKSWKHIETQAFQAVFLLNAEFKDVLSRVKAVVLLLGDVEALQRAVQHRVH